jgi:hypothetical protein
MEKTEMENSWRDIDSILATKSIGELDKMLTLKTRKTMNKFFLLLGTDIIVCVGLMIFLIITALNRQGDSIYQLNNILLCMITFSSLIISMLSWIKLHHNKFNLPLKDWLEVRIRLLSGWLLGKYSKLYIVLLPVLLVMINLSIHVYYEYKPFIEVMKSRESLVGLVVGFVVGLAVSFYVLRKIRSYQVKNLEFLRELHSRCTMV